MSSVYFDPAVGGDGTTVTDDSNATTGLGNGGHRTRFVPALSQTVAVAANTVTKATEAASSAATASNWATKVDGFVSGSDNSSKAWAIGGTGSGDPVAGSSKDWATQTSTTVDGTEYSAKEYASGTVAQSSKQWATKTSGNVDGSEFSSKEYAVGTNIRGVAGKGSAKDWATYTAGTVDGIEYSAKKYAQDAATIYDNFDDRYLGAKAVAPTTDNDGNPLVDGALFTLTTGGNPGFRVWISGAWVEPAGSVNADFVIARQTITATAGQTVFNLSTAYTVGVNAIAVYVNGVRQFDTAYTETNSTTITFSSGLALGDVVLFEQGTTIAAGTVAASAVSVTPVAGMSAGNVQAGLSELKTGKQDASANLSSWAGLAPSAKQDTLVSGTNIKTLNGGSILGSGDITVGSSLLRSARTSDTILAAGDKGYLIDYTSGTFSQTLTAAATLGNGWFCYVKNSGTGFVTLDPNGSETIEVEGFTPTTWVLWPGESGLLQCSGTGFALLRITKGSITQTVSSAVASVSFSTGIAYRKKLKITAFDVDNSSSSQNQFRINNTSPGETRGIRTRGGSTIEVMAAPSDNFTVGTVAQNGGGLTNSLATVWNLTINSIGVHAQFASRYYNPTYNPDFGFGSSLWDGITTSNITSLDFVASNYNFTNGTFIVEEL